MVVTSGAFRARNQSQVRQTPMFLVTRRAGTILDHVRFVKAVLLMTTLAFPIDRFDRNAVPKPIAQDLRKFPASCGGIVTFRAIVGELRVRSRDFPGVKKSFASAAREKKNREKSAEDC